MNKEKTKTIITKLAEVESELFYYKTSTNDQSFEECRKKICQIMNILKTDDSN